MKIKVHVSRDDIESGMPGSLFACPIANALNRRKGLAHARVYSPHIYITKISNADENTEYLFTLPEVAQKFAREFDTYGALAAASPKPFSFVLDDA